jgi:hypothetical protein
MALSTITVYILDANLNLAGTRDKKVNLAACRPIDIIQLIYQDGFNVSVPGGSTIWKMGRCAQLPNPPVEVNPKPGTLFAENAFLSDPINGVHDQDHVVLIEKAVV